MIISIAFAKSKWSQTIAQEFVTLLGLKTQRQSSNASTITFRQHNKPNKSTPLVHRFPKVGITIRASYTAEQVGEGILDKVKSTLSEIKRRGQLFLDGPKMAASNKFKQMLQENQSPIVQMWACKTPVMSGVKKVLNIISLGALERKQKQLGYSEVYHAYLVVKLADGKMFVLEKNHAIEGRRATAKDLINAAEIPLDGKSISMATLIDNADDSPQFWQYRAKTDNCQFFVQKVVKENRLGGDKKVEEIIKPQDSANLISSAKHLEPISNFVTDLAGRANRVIDGSGMFDIDINTLMKYAPQIQAMAPQVKQIAKEFFGRGVPDPNNYKSLLKKCKC